MEVTRLTKFRRIQHRYRFSPIDNCYDLVYAMNFAYYRSGIRRKWDSFREESYHNKENHMTSMTKTAQSFFEDCETGKGWESCRSYCTPDATFQAQAEPLL